VSIEGFILPGAFTTIMSVLKRVQMGEDEIAFSMLTAIDAQTCKFNCKARDFSKNKGYIYEVRGYNSSDSSLENKCFAIAFK
jgi:hypothetical protein